MPSRFQIREAVVKFLYCADLEGSADDASLRGPFWDFVSESEHRSLQETTLWTVQQLAQERKGFLSDFVEREALAIKQISAWTRAESLKIDLEHIAVMESEWSTAFAKLEHLPKLDGDSLLLENFGEKLDLLLKLDGDLAEARRQFLVNLDSFPTLRGQLELVVNKIRQLVMEADDRSQQLRAFQPFAHPSRKEEDDIGQPANRVTQATVLLSAWKQYCQRRRRRIPRATASVILSEWPQGETLETDLRRISELESGWSACVAGLERLLKSDDEASEVEGFSAELARLFKLDRELADARGHFLESIRNFPALRGQLESVASTIRRLQLISDVLQMAEEPENFPEQADLARLLDSKKSILKLRKKSDELVDSILVKREQIDKMLVAVFENFAPERIDPVDHAILRLGTYEILHAGTPPKVAMNEAIQLAKRFGTADSSRFVNGVLDKIAKQSVEKSVCDAREEG